MTSAIRIEAPALARLPGIRHGFFTRQGGVSGGLYASLNGGMGSQDTLAHVEENRARMAAVLDIAPQALVACWQVHSASAVILTHPWTRAQAPQADGVVTAVTGLGATVTVADCGPVLLADPVARVVGAAHAGWKGALKGILADTIAKMEDLGAQPSRIIAAIGPLIRQESYEVSEDFMAPFLEEDRGHSRFFRTAERAGHAWFDLPGFIALRLRQAGVGQVEDLGLNTYGDETRFFSYRRATHRREADYGRMVAAITLC